MSSLPEAVAAGIADTDSQVYKTLAQIFQVASMDVVVSLSANAVAANVQAAIAKVEESESALGIKPTLVAMPGLTWAIDTSPDPRRSHYRRASL